MLILTFYMKDYISLNKLFHKIKVLAHDEFVIFIDFYNFYETSHFISSPKIKFEVEWLTEGHTYCDKVKIGCFGYVKYIYTHTLYIIYISKNIHIF